jgi:hypothetical protein
MTMNEQHIARLKELFDQALSRCNCGGFCEECVMLKAEFLEVTTDILNETESNPYVRVAKGLEAV